MRIDSHTGMTRIADQPEDGLLIFWRRRATEVDSIRAPDQFLDAARRRRATDKLQKCFAGPPPFSDEVLEG